ncbi:hypothetical protein CFSAN001628_006729 [Clostridium botulinum CFSAN001628]|uniref:Uncharacterized protein n=1 Tax=Clostridium botulinum (strain Okra / Type B1) TaxID=498213 RepID=B1IGR3_CLOBK|nr:hypothetical protein CLD_2414 [Clostridium botulinum B1 str. Okra]EKX80483.1 hypothetical protein CFSAN001628_006729 [Clostridium botulinum CFSAN001628]
MPKVIIVEPDITPEENEENLKRVIEVLESIAQEIAEY